MRWVKRILGIIAAAAVVLAIAFALSPKPVPVELGTVARGPFEQTVDEDGRTRVRERYTVVAPIAGTVLRITLKAGDEVSEGTVLASVVAGPSAMIDLRMRQELEQRVGAAEAVQMRAGAAVKRSEATLEQASADLERTQRLAASGVASRSRLERDELVVRVGVRELEAARFDEHTAEHELALARAALANPTGDDSGAPWTIRSPVPGRVFRVIQESGGPVAIGAPLLEIGNPHDLEVVVDVLSTDAVAISPGAVALIERWGGDHPLDGRVRRVEPSAFTKVSALGVEEQRVNVIIDIVSSREEWSELGDGFRIDARIVTFRADDVLKVPTSALFREGDDWKLFVAAQGVAHKRTVRVLRRTGLEAMVGGGVTEGEAVILYPGDALKDGVSVAAR
jgi:HlyD family secretion protein